jgi:hypothetical protein
MRASSFPACPATLANLFSVDESLFAPYLHMLGLAKKRKLIFRETIPIHIHQVTHDVDGVMGGATNLLYIGTKIGN